MRFFGYNNPQMPIFIFRQLVYLRPSVPSIIKADIFANTRGVLEFLMKVTFRSLLKWLDEEVALLLAY